MTLGQLNYVASCRSSTTEGASDVSPSHLFHLASGTCRVFGLFCVLGVFVFGVCFPCFACAGGFFLILIENAR